jgi:hypothetical protein
MSCIPSDGDLDSEDDESVCELKGDELERNLETLRARLCVEEGVGRDSKSGLEQITEVKTSTEWKKFERARGLGYNGHSERTHRRCNKEAWDRAAAREKLKTS